MGQADPYADMSPAEICDIALHNMKLMESPVIIRCRMQDSWQFTRNTDRLAAYKRKRLAHDALHGYDAAMAAKCLASLET